MIQQGSIGANVRVWQAIIGVATDGVFGPTTDAATKAWQAAHGLVADGVVGPKSWAAAGVTDTAPQAGIAGAIPFVQAKSYTRANRGGGKITAIVIHTMEAPEGPKTAENVATWFAGANAPKASAHYNVDAYSIVQSVRDADIAWHAGPVNDWSIGIEHAGYAKQTPAEWADHYSIAMLERSAKLVAQLCVRYAIPVRRLSAADLSRGERRGIFGHVDVTKGLTGGKGHTDPGDSFPWMTYLALVEANVAAEASELVEKDDEPPAGFVEVVLDGVIWLVEPAPTLFCSIGEAEDRAKAAGCELPSPALVDAIWRAADIRVSPAETIQSHNGTPAGMNAPELYASVRTAIDVALAGRVVGRDVRLVAGATKDVVVSGGKLGLYGWHVEDTVAFAARLRRRLGTAVALHAPATAGAGRVVQPFYGGHARAWRDYSQSVRLVRKKST